MVLLRVWNSKKHAGGGWGHSTLEVGGLPPAGIYISWWPGESWGAKLGDSLPSFADNKTFAQDLAIEGHPSATFRLDGLDERAIKVWWMHRRGSRLNMMYTWAGWNCSSTVALALQAGGADNLARKGGWTSAPLMWTPFDLAAYARAIRAGQESAIRTATS